MQKNYSPNEVKFHYELLDKVNHDLPNVMIGALLDAAFSNVSPTECLLRAMGRTLCVLEKITDSECKQISTQNADKSLDIISKVNDDLLLVLKFNIIDTLADQNFSAYEATIHLVLDTLFLLRYITDSEFDKAYKAGGTND